MKIASRDVPQADRLDVVLDIVTAVGHGAATYQDLSKVIRYVERQGRYYRRAAEILGFTARGTRNTSELTPKGHQWLAADPPGRRALLAQAVLSSPMIQRIIPLLESKHNGCTRQELEGFIVTVTEPAGPTMVPRRTATVVSWLEEIGMLSVHGEVYYLQPPPPHVAPIRYASDSEPLLPRTFDLREYATPARRMSARPGATTYAVSHALRERANSAHQSLTALVAEKLRLHGSVPRCNSFVDLAASVSGALYIFEVKSTRPFNTHAQVRQGVSQLYEYQYLQAAPGARLVLVIEQPIPERLAWLVDYLVADRGILLVWDGAGRTLYCDPRQQRDLPFLR